MRSHAGMAKQTRGRRMRSRTSLPLVSPLVGWLVASKFSYNPDDRTDSGPETLV
jgi:hypothetical protein